MKKGRLFSLATAFLVIASGLSGGEVLLTLSKPDEFYASKFIKLQSDGSLLLTRGAITSRKKIPVSPEKRYRVSCELRNTAPGKPPRVRIGINPMHPGGSANISGNFPVAGTETEVVRNSRSSDKVIYLKDCSEWKNVPTRIAFDVDPTGSMRDIPNFDLLNGHVLKWTKKGDLWEVQMGHPVRVDLDKGVCVRQHIASRSAIVSGLKPVTAQWQKIDFVIGPGLAASVTETDKLFNGVTHAAFTLQAPEGILVRNIQIEEIK